MFFVMFKDADNEYVAVNQVWFDIQEAIDKCLTIDAERLPVVVAGLVGKMPDTGEMALAPIAQEINALTAENKDLRRQLGIETNEILSPAAPGVN